MYPLGNVSLHKQKPNSNYLNEPKGFIGSFKAQRKIGL